jgi:hypothetical protein
MSALQEKAAPSGTTPPFQSFEDFWPFYLGEHRHPVSRALHYCGTTAGTLTVLLALVGKHPLLVPLALLVGYGSAWIGHFVFEKNRPASFKHPLWSLRADYRMLRLFLTGRLDQEFRDVRKRSA